MRPGQEALVVLAIFVRRQRIALRHPQRDVLVDAGDELGLAIAQRVRVPALEFGHRAQFGLARRDVPRDERRVLVSRQRVLGKGVDPVGRCLLEPGLALVRGVDDRLVEDRVHAGLGGAGVFRRRPGSQASAELLALGRNLGLERRAGIDRSPALQRQIAVLTILALAHPGGECVVRFLGPRSVLQVLDRDHRVGHLADPLRHRAEAARHACAHVLGRGADGQALLKQGPLTDLSGLIPRNDRHASPHTSADGFL